MIHFHNCRYLIGLNLLSFLLSSFIRKYKDESCYYRCWYYRYYYCLFTCKEGIDVVLIDSGRILNGTTGHTTAKVTAQHDLIYDELINHFGVEKAGLYYESNNQALQFINKTVQTYKIDCNFSNEDSYLYTTTDNGLRNLSKEYEAYQN